MAYRSVFGLIGTAALAVGAAVVVSMTTREVRTTRIVTNSSHDGIGSGSVTIIKMPVTHVAHPFLAAALLVAALAVAALTVWQARLNPREAS